MSEYVVLGSGPSLNAHDCTLVHHWRDSNLGRYVVAVNRAYLLAPFADYYFATDIHWWLAEYKHVTSMMDVSAQLWSVNDVKEHPDIHKLRDCRDADGNKVYDHGSGLKAVRLTEHLGSTRTGLVGFDFGADDKGQKHFHEDYPHPLVNHVSFGTAPRSEFKMPVFQCSRRSLDVRANWFPRIALESFLQDGTRMELKEWLTR